MTFFYKNYFPFILLYSKFDNLTQSHNLYFRHCLNSRILLFSRKTNIEKLPLVSAIGGGFGSF